MITKSLLVFWSTVSLWNLLVHPRFCLWQSQMGLLSKNIPYLCDNFLLSAYQFTASSQGNGKFTEFIRLHGASHGADSISQKWVGLIVGDLMHSRDSQSWLSVKFRVDRTNSTQLVGWMLVGWIGSNSRDYLCKTFAFRLWGPYLGKGLSKRKYGGCLFDWMQIAEPSYW